MQQLAQGRGGAMRESISWSGDMGAVRIKADVAPDSRLQGRQAAISHHHVFPTVIPGVRLVLAVQPLPNTRPEFRSAALRYRWLK
jgi:hypothetical protein